MKNFIVITLFPEMLEGYLGQSMMEKAGRVGAANFEFINLREFGDGPRRTVDDAPYGGGDGMLLKVEPLHKAILEAKSCFSSAKVALLTPKGLKLSQSMANDLAESESDLILVCGRYEGYDERVLKYIDMQISIGDYVLTGGEIAALAVIDSVVRLLPGVLGGEESAEIESFQGAGDLEFPQYTRPEVYDEQSVPEILLSGNHGEINKWRENNRTKSEG